MAPRRPLHRPAPGRCSARRRPWHGLLTALACGSSLLALPWAARAADADQARYTIDGDALGVTLRPLGSPGAGIVDRDVI